MIKKRHLGKMLLLVGALFFSSMAFSQESMSADQIGQDWTLYSTQNGVEFYIKTEDCDVGAKDLFTYAQVRLVNTTASDKSVQFHFELYHELMCVGCGDVREYRKTVTVPANSMLEGNKEFTTPELSLLINNPYQTGVGSLESIKLIQPIIEEL